MRSPGWRVACAAALLAAVAGSAALADPSDGKRPAKPSSFAPRHSASHVYGTPIAKPILHRHKKPAHAAAPSAETAATAPIK